MRNLPVRPSKNVAHPIIVENTIRRGGGEDFYGQNRHFLASVVPIVMFDLLSWMLEVAFSSDPHVVVEMLWI